MAKKSLTKPAASVADTVRSLAKLEDRRKQEAHYGGPPWKWFAVDPDMMFPAMIDLILSGANPTDRTTVGDAGPEIDADPAEYRKRLAAIRSLPAQAFDDALLPLVEGRDGPPTPPAFGLPPARRAAREKVLEAARLWFTNELHRLNGGGCLGVHILKAAGPYRWKL